MSTDEPTAPQDQGPPAPQKERKGWTFGRVLAMVLASLVGLLGLCLLLGGLAIVVAHGVIRDDDGFYESGTERIATESYAITSDEIDLDIGPADWAGEDLLGTLRITAESSGDGPLFLGIAPTRDVTRYLAGVRHDVLVDFEHTTPEFETRPGNRRPGLPERQPFWEAQSQGTGERTLEWDVESGIWSIVAMNADGSPGLDLEAEVGVKLDWVIWVGIALLVAGLILTAAAVILIVFVGRRASRDAHPPQPQAGVPGASA